LNPAALISVLDDPPSINHPNSGLSAADIAEVKVGYTKAFRLIWYVLIGLAALSTMVAAFTIKQETLKMQDEEEQKAKSKAWLAERKARKVAKKGHHGEGEEVDLEKQNVEGAS